MVGVCLLLGTLGPVASADAKGGFSYGPDQLELVSSERLSDRLVELEFRTPAVEGETRVRVLLPDGYNGDGGRRYPVLYLLHGCCGGNSGYRTWTEGFPLEELTAGKPLIVVMPDSGPQGGYVDWYNGGEGGPPMWETYHIGQLLPWIDQHFKTEATREARAVAGLSMGGYGAVHYAARHPDLFVAAQSFSGPVNTNSVFLAATATFDPTVTGFGTRPHGPRATEEVRSRGHNPWDLAENLDGVELALRTGNGAPGGPGNACCGGGSDQTGDLVEMEVHEENVSMHRRLVELGIPHVWDDYGPACHCVYYWERSLEKLIPDLERIFADPPPAPPQFGYRSIDPEYEVYGWQVAIDRPALEWSALRNASRTGFALSGSGAARVTTPPLYPAGRTVDVELVLDGRVESRAVRVGDDCRLRLELPLGPGNPHQQYTAQARTHGMQQKLLSTPGTAPYEDMTGTAVYTTRVRIDADRKSGCGRST